MNWIRRIYARLAGFRMEWDEPTPQDPADSAGDYGLPWDRSDEDSVNGTLEEIERLKQKPNRGRVD